MKRILILLLFILPFYTMAQSDKNHIEQTAYQVKTTDGIHKAGTTTDLLPEDIIKTTNYFDGLGRAVQSVNQRAGGQNQDVITHIEYDQFGRQIKEFLPYATTSNGGLFRADALNSVKGFYNTQKYENTLNPYSERSLEASPLNRVLEQAAPGNDWMLTSSNSCYDPDSPYYNTNDCVDYRTYVNSISGGNGSCYYEDYYAYDEPFCVSFRNNNPLPPSPIGSGNNDHTIKFEYATNTNLDYVRQFGVSFPTSNTEFPQLVDEGLYPVNELHKTVTKDENWQLNQTYPNDHTTEEYKDKQGRVILKRTFNLGKWHDTYYVYDDYGNLTYVLPPKMNTYKSILQQNWIGQSYYFDDVPGLYVFSTAYNDISFYFSSTGTFSISIYAEGNMIQLKDGLVMDLGFISPSLPDMNLGTMNFGNGNPAGSAYIQSGNLYFASSGNYDSTSGDFWSNLSVNLLDHQNGFVPSIDQTQLDNLAYQYRYDVRNRIIEKKIPGKGKEYIVYDRLDRPILTQDANLKVQNKWLFTKYDPFGRVAYTGIKNTNKTREVLQTEAQDDIYSLYEFVMSTYNTHNQNSGIDFYYSSNTYPNSFDEILTLNYYDSYIDLPSGLSNTITNTFNIPSNTNTKGLPTVSKVKVLGTSYWITTVTYYDEKFNPMYVYSKNSYLGTTDIVESEFDFTGKVIRSKATHKKTGQIDLVTMDAFVYDHAGRLVSQKQNINNQGEELIAKNHYDELGQLVKKDVGHTELQPLQQVDYTYNIRGWLKTINDPTNLNQNGDLFSFGLNYNKPEGPSTTYNAPLYNGNISHAYWKTNNVDGGLKHYSYKYDALNRFANAYFAENHVYNSKFNEYIYGYDRNGNIHGLYRSMQNPSNPNSSVSMDNLTYTYDNGNKLLEVKDSYGLTTNGKEGFKDGSLVTMPGPGDDYVYDANGNMVADRNKGITSIIYNHFNLPIMVSIDYDNVTAGSISYVYDATGVKLRKTVNDNGILGPHTYYAGNYVYEGSSLKFFNQPEGYVEPKNQNDLSQGFDYVYQYKDHLGNIRLSYSDSDNSGTITGENNFITVWEDGFESATGWDGTGASWGHALDAFDTTVKHSGNYSGRIDVHGDGSGYGSRSVHSLDWVPINNSVNTEYRISQWFFMEDIPQWSRARIELMLKEEGETAYTTSYEYDFLYEKGKWVFAEKTILVPPNIKYLNFRITYDYSNTTSGSIWYDDLKIERVEPTNNSEIVEENNYYPFGLHHTGYNNNPTASGIALNFTYNGKEFDKSLNLNTFDLGARHMDPAIGRFMTIDPMADFFNNQSPYAMANNNPIANVDYYGLGIFNALGNVFKRIGNGVRKLFSGNSCNCTKAESLGDAFRRPDFGWYKSNKKSSTTYGNSRRPRGGAKPINMGSSGLADLGGADITSPELPRIVPTPPKITRTKTPEEPSSKEKEEDDDSRKTAPPVIGVQYFDIPFIGGYTKLKISEESALKILSDLIKTLKEYPQLKVIVDGQVGVSNWKVRPTDLKARAEVNGGVGPLEWLSGGRANAIIKLLKENGVKAEQLIKGKGILGDESSVIIRGAK